MDNPDPPYWQIEFAMSAPMNEYQSTTLRKLSIEAYEPKLFAEDPASPQAEFCKEISIPRLRLGCTISIRPRSE
jgi:hypothetical protein